MTRDTIFAVSTPPGTGGVAVIRISGPLADETLAAMTDQPLPPARHAVLRKVTDPETGATLDHPLVLRFADGQSFTGEAVIELHLHGGRAVVASVLHALGRRDGLRLAEPGEFTRRAFDHGRLDLAQVEGLADLIAAETASQQRAALHQYSGIIGERCRAWSAQLTRGLALLEATIDFADEDIPLETWQIATDEIVSVRDAIRSDLEAAHPAERLRDGWRVAILGAPNVGKSTLLNTLARRDVAIVSDIPGTTRDSIEVHLDLGGYPVTLIDTAGLRIAQDTVERIGIERTTRMAEAADLRIAVASPDAPLADDTLRLLHEGDLRVWNKTDIAPPPDSLMLGISAQSGDGIATVIDHLRAAVESGIPPADALLLQQRHRAAMADALDALDAYAGLASDDPDRIQAAPELAAQMVREAWESLGRITGERGIDRLLDVIFSEFCLGK